MPTTDIRQLIDLDRYPLDQPDHPVFAQLLDDGRRALEQGALFSMVRFVRPEAIAIMVRQLEALRTRSCRYEHARNAYVYDGGASDWPDDHPRALRHRCSYNQVLNYQIPNNSPLRLIYYWQPLTEFLRQLCGFETFYRSDCPHFALTSKIAGEGDTDGWHFDTNDVVFSLLLQTPEAGGEFEYAPFIRSEQDENYDGVKRVVADPQRSAVRPPMGLGDFNVFMGDLSLHRVKPVIGAQRRIVALFSYDRDPGMVFDQSYVDEMHQAMTN
ncbi:MAG: hypothetical protein LJE92_20200 [Gammaproteobacteria bacterium]|jgi:hypothetical protein|nr:hypothetical protein [Gammaproteobacteria bacterium]